MNKPAALREPMDMPDPYFPVKLHTCRHGSCGREMFPPHWHEHMEVLYFTKGEAVIECNSVPFRVREGDVLMLNCNDLHQGTAVTDEVEYYALISDLSLLQSPSPDALEVKFVAPFAQNRILFQHLIRDDEAVARVMDAIVQEFADQQIGYELAVKSSIFRLLALLIRGYTVETPKASSGDNTRRRNLERFAPIFEYIEQHYLEEISVSQLSRFAGLSRFHFSRLFSELTGRTVTEYVNHIRISKSEYLLRNTEMTISEIALASGYQDISYFSRTFKKFKSVPPSEFRTFAPGEGAEM
ncbi:AraC family transcriptional regulator [Paenibacillus physcomitrellae]|uniref:AraC family transcriptional regulator n=1 Tax=Paenibacillus physcomitrellae TaxID=1619311 RepID=A0ABQ1FRG9_9BACL|nr:AraC family transcriptional regulator [Paenibacillus physcomitrellae]GGA26365.1 AraC family transcriptional regulator [Paenibacillus physcomitrellae]